MAISKRIPACAEQLHARRDRVTDRPDETTTDWRSRIPGSSFFWPMRLLPAPRRTAMHALYLFCRKVHGVTRGSAARAVKLGLLSEWRAEIALLYASRPQHIVTQALRAPVNRFDLRFEDFLLVLDGMEMEARSDIRAPSLAQLDLYCERTAVAVGRLALRIFGAATPEVERLAAALGRALQLTCIVRDLAQDASRQHLYLPREMLHAHGIFATMPNYVLAQPELPQVCNALGLRAAEYFVEAESIIAVCPPLPMWPVAATLSTYRELLDGLLARGWMRLDEPVRIPVLRQIVRHIGGASIVERPALFPRSSPVPFGGTHIEH